MSCRRREPGPVNATTAHISNASKSCWGHLRSLEKLSLFLANAIAVSLIISRLDYCSRALCGLPANQLNRLQKTQNAAAGIVTNRNSRDRKCYPVLRSPLRLPKRVEYKIISLILMLVSNCPTVSAETC